VPGRRVAHFEESFVSSSTHYTRTAIALHWLIALCLVALFGLGLTMTGLPFSPFKLKVYSWHKWAGVTVFALVVVRLVWRLTHTPPPAPLSMPSWQQQAAALGHGVLYLLMFAIPLSGWLMSSAKGFQTVYLGVLPLPDLVGKNTELGDTLAGVHAWLNYLMCAVVIGHALAALKHHLLDRDDVLLRMSPRHLRRGRSSSF